AELSSCVADANVRVLLVTTTDPSALRLAVETAQARGVAVVVGCSDEASRRRAVELRAEEWVLMPTSASEVAARVWSAIARSAMTAANAGERAEKAEYEQMLHDSMTGRPTRPVVIGGS